MSGPRLPLVSGPGTTSGTPQVNHGVPAEEAHVFAEIFGTVLDGRNAHLTDGLQRALGRDFATCAGTDVWP
jgi:hypothetical protein